MNIDKTCVVAFNNIEYIDNWKALPPVFTQEVMGEHVKFLIHKSPLIEIHGGSEITNFDLLIDGYVTGSKSPFITKPDYQFVRYHKTTQTVMLKNIADELGLNHFIPTEVLNKHPEESPSNIYQVSHLPQKVLIKPVDGARGLSHVIFDTLKGNIFAFINQLSYTNNDEETKAVIDRHAEALEFYTGELNNAGEDLYTLRQQKLLLTTVVPDITKEIRVVLDHQSKPSVLKVRDRRSTRSEEMSGLKDITGTYLQATGTERSKGVDNFTEVVPIEFQDEITALLGKLPPLNSVDLFFTDKGWGVFEFCNQFGMYAFDISDMVKLHKDFIVHLYTSKFLITN